MHVVIRSSSATDINLKEYINPFIKIPTACKNGYN